MNTFYNSGTKAVKLIERSYHYDFSRANTNEKVTFYSNFNITSI